MNSNGPKIEPWATPTDAMSGSDFAADAWNALPLSLRDVLTLSQFKRGIKKAIFNFLMAQGVTLALARSPRRVSKVSGERKSSITRPFGEYDFNCQEMI